MPKPHTTSRPISVSSETVGENHQVVAVGLAEARRLAFLLRERLHHPDAGDGVGQHVGDLGPDAVDLLEAGAQPVAHDVDHPADEGQRHQRHQRQPRVDREQDGRRHHDHQHVGGEIERVQRQEDVDPVGLGPDARHQVAGALAAEIFERQLQQVLIGGGAQVGTDAFTDERQNVSARPPQAPGGERRGQQAAEVQGDVRGVDRLPVLERDQDLVHQRHAEVRRHQRGAGGRKRQDKPEQQLPAVGFGEARQPQQHPGRGRLVLGALAGRALLRVRRQRCVAAGADGFVVQSRRRAAGAAGLPSFEQLQETNRCNVVFQREAQARPQAFRLDDVQLAHTSLVAVAQRQGRRQLKRKPVLT
jgi:hypothetical protein